MNVYRINLLPTLLLLCNVIDTNDTLTDFLIDKWIFIKFKTENDAMKVLTKAMKIRRRIHYLIYNKLETEVPPLTNVKIPIELLSTPPPELVEINKLFSSITPPHTKTSNDICEDILDLYYYKISYNVEYIPSNISEAMISGIKALNEINEGDSMRNLESQVIMNTNNIKRKGVQITECIWFNSLHKIDKKNGLIGFNEFMTKEWTCIYCNKKFFTNHTDMVNHLSQCSLKSDNNNE